MYDLPILRSKISSRYLLPRYSILSQAHKPVTVAETPNQRAAGGPLNRCHPSESQRFPSRIDFASESIRIRPSIASIPGLSCGSGSRRSRVSSESVAPAGHPRAGDGSGHVGIIIEPDTSDLNDDGTPRLRVRPATGTRLPPGRARRRLRAIITRVCAAVAAAVTLELEGALAVPSNDIMCCQVSRPGRRRSGRRPTTTSDS